MIGLLSALSSYEINTSSRVRAIQSVRELGFDEKTYRSMILDLTGQEIEGDEFIVENTFKYLVDQAMTNGYVDLNKALELGVKFVDANPWIKAQPKHTSYYVPKSTVDACGNPKQKKGAKKDKAVSLWVENQGKVNSRKDWIDLLVKEVGLSPAGASTYYHNLNTGLYNK